MTPELDHAIMAAALELINRGPGPLLRTVSIPEIQRELGHNPHKKYTRPTHPNKIRAVLKRNGYEEIANAVFRKRK